MLNRILVNNILLQISVTLHKQLLKAGINSLNQQFPPVYNKVRNPQLWKQNEDRDHISNGQPIYQCSFSKADMLQVAG